MKKKLISMLLMLAMLGGAAGCTKTAKEGADGGVPTLTWLMPCESQSDLESVQEAMNNIFIEKVGAKVDIQFISPGAFSEKMKMKMASNDDFDICFAGWVNNYSNAAKSGGLMDITDLIDQVDGLRDVIPDYVWDAATVNGKIYGVPNIQIQTLLTSAMVYTDIADKYSFDFSGVKHIEDVEPYLEIVKQNEPGIYPIAPAYGVLPWYSFDYDSIGFEHIVLPRGATSADELTYTFETEEWNRGVNKLWDWYQKGYIRSDVLSVGDDMADRKAGKYAVDIGGWKPGGELSWENSYGHPVKAYPLQEPYVAKNGCLSTVLCLGPNCKNSVKALEIIKLMHTDAELLNLMTFGIEGKHYNMVDNRVQVIAGSGYDQGATSWKFGCQWNAKLIPGQEDNLWEETRAMNENATKSSLMKFDFDATPVKTEISNLTNIDKEYEVFNKGAADPETYMDEFIKKMKDAGIEKVYDEVKKQLEEYFASQN